MVFASGSDSARRQAELEVLPRLLQLQEHSTLASVVVDAENSASTLTQGGLLEQLFLAYDFMALTFPPWPCNRSLLV